MAQNVQPWTDYQVSSNYVESCVSLTNKGLRYGWWHEALEVSRVANLVRTNNFVCGNAVSGPNELIVPLQTGAPYRPGDEWAVAKVDKALITSEMAELDAGDACCCSCDCSEDDYDDEDNEDECEEDEELDDYDYEDDRTSLSRSNRCWRFIRKYYRYFQQSVKALVEHKYFQQGLLGAILINTLSMGIEYHNQVSGNINPGMAERDECIDDRSRESVRCR